MHWRYWRRREAEPRPSHLIAPDGRVRLAFSRRAEMPHTQSQVQFDDFLSYSRHSRQAFIDINAALKQLTAPSTLVGPSWLWYYSSRLGMTGDFPAWFADLDHLRYELRILLNETATYVDPVSPSP